MFEPVLNETRYFSHYTRKLVYCLVQFVRVRNFLESVELAGQNLDALCEAFHRFFLVLEMLPISSVI